MKKIFSLCLVIIVVLSLSVGTFAKESMIGSQHPEFGELVESVKTIDESGFELVENTYRQNRNRNARATSGTDTFTKTATGIASGIKYVDYQVTGTFKWNSTASTVYVSNVSGKITYNEGNAAITKKKTAISGDGTKKGSAKYSFTRTTSLGGVNNKSVTLSCDSNGKNS